MGTRAEHLKVWIRGETQEKNPDTRRGGKLVSMTKLAFREGITQTALTWMMMVIITKNRGDYRGISLVEVIWKVCALISNNRI